MKKYIRLTSAALLAISSSVFAEQALTDTQMDQVSAGATVLLVGAAIGNAGGFSISSINGVTNSVSSATADPTGALLGGAPIAVATASNTSTGLSAMFIDPATNTLVAGTQSNSTASASASLQ